MALLIIPLYLCPRQHVAMIPKPTFGHYADMQVQLVIRQPYLVRCLVVLLSHPINRRDDLRLQLLPIHTMPNV